jgi:predicted nucleic acid-binding protein
MELALTDLIRARWTEDIQSEWIENLLANRPDLSRSRLERTTSLMNKYVRDSLIKDYHYLIPDLTLPDPDDLHVLAAAIHGNASKIITFNLKDFPPSLLNQHNIIAEHPDQFIANLSIDYPIEMKQVVYCCQERLKNPSKSMDEYLITLEKQGLLQTVKIFHSFGL